MPASGSAASPFAPALPGPVGSTIACRRPQRRTSPSPPRGARRCFWPAISQREERAIRFCYHQPAKPERGYLGVNLRPSIQDRIHPATHAPPSHSPAESHGVGSVYETVYDRNDLRRSTGQESGSDLPTRFVLRAHGPWPPAQSRQVKELEPGPETEARLPPWYSQVLTPWTVDGHAHLSQAHEPKSRTVPCTPPHPPQPRAPHHGAFAHSTGPMRRPVRAILKPGRDKGIGQGQTDSRIRSSTHVREPLALSASAVGSMPDSAMIPQPKFLQSGSEPVGRGSAPGSASLFRAPSIGKGPDLSTAPVPSDIPPLCKMPPSSLGWWDRQGDGWSNLPQCARRGSVP